MSPRTIALSTLLALLLCACMADDRDATHENTAPATQSARVLQSGNVLAGRTFRSIETKEMGFGPEGVAMGHWQISFSSTGFEWVYADVVESGTYVLDGTAVVASGSGRQILGEYDVDRDVLTWDRADYRPVDARQ